MIQEQNFTEQSELTKQKENIQTQFSQKDNFKQNIEENSQSYVQVLMQKGHINNELLKKTFEDYMSSVKFSFNNDNPAEKCEKQKQHNFNQFKNKIKEEHKFLKLKKLQVNYYNFFALIDSIWKCKHLQIEDVKGLHQCQVVLLFSIIRKKFNMALDLSSPQKITEDLNYLKNLLNNKRVEEINKFILKKFFRKISQIYQNNLHQQFKQNCLPEMQQNTYVQLFDVKNKHQIVISSINNKNITTLMAENTFQEKIKQYYETQFLEDYQKEMTTKLFQLSVKLQTRLEKINNLQVFKEYQKKIEQDPKTKYPWTISEAQNAIDIFFENEFIPKKLSQRNEK